MEATPTSSSELARKSHPGDARFRLASAPLEPCWAGERRLTFDLGGGIRPLAGKISDRTVAPAATSSERTSVLFLGLVLVASAMLLILGLRIPLAGSAATICTAGAALRPANDRAVIPAIDFIGGGRT